MPRFYPKRCLAGLLLLFLAYAVYRNFAQLEERVHVNIDHLKGLAPSFHSVDAEHPDKELVIATRSTDDDTSWVYALGGDWQWKVYAADQLGDVPVDKGLENIVYLSYIIDNYNHLPEIVVFTHGKRYEWFHDDPIYDIVPVLDNLRFPHVFSTGYVPLRCTWTPGCPAEIFPRSPISKGPAVRKLAEKHYARAWSTIFPDQPVPAVVGATSSSQFAVTRERIKSRKLEEYQRMRRWLYDTRLKDHVSAKIMEYMWHIIMQMPSVYCPPADKCYCNVFGHCNITCSLGNCEGRYFLPPQADVPQDWPNLGGGKDGWPVPGWNKGKGEPKTGDKKESVEEKIENDKADHDDGKKKIPVAVQGEWKPEAQEDQHSSGS